MRQQLMCKQHAAWFHIWRCACFGNSKRIALTGYQMRTMR